MNIIIQICELNSDVYTYCIKIYYLNHPVQYTIIYTYVSIQSLQLRRRLSVMPAVSLGCCVDRLGGGDVGGTHHLTQSHHLLGESLQVLSTIRRALHHAISESFPAHTHTHVSTRRLFPHVNLCVSRKDRRIRFAGVAPRNHHRNAISIHVNIFRRHKSSGRPKHGRL